MWMFKNKMYTGVYAHLAWPIAWAYDIGPNEDTHQNRNTKFWLCVSA